MALVGCGIGGPERDRRLCPSSEMDAMDLYALAIQHGEQPTIWHTRGVATLIRVPAVVPQAMRAEYGVHEIPREGTPPEGMALATIRSVTPGTPLAGRVEECSLWVGLQGSLRLAVSIDYPRVILHLSASETALMVSDLLSLPDTRVANGPEDQGCYDVVTSYRLLGKTADACVPLLYGPLTIRCAAQKNPSSPEVTAPGTLIRYKPFTAEFDPAFARTAPEGGGGAGDGDGGGGTGP